MRKVLVTGATGLIGRHLIASLSSRYEIHAIVRRPLVTDQVTCHLADLASPNGLEGLPSDIDAVVHLAQSRHYREFPRQARDIFDVNVASTVRLLDWARTIGVTTFLYASSGGVYGHGEDSFREDEPTQPPEPLGFYLSTKRSAELLIEPYSAFFSTVTLRFFFVYGTGQGETMLVPRLINSVAHGRPVMLQGPTGIRINPVHVSDAVRAVDRALDLSGTHHVNVAGGEVLSLRDMTESIGSHLGVAPVFDIQENERPRSLIGDITKMRRLLTRPEVGFYEGVREVCEEIRVG